MINTYSDQLDGCIFLPQGATVPVPGVLLRRTSKVIP